MLINKALRRNTSNEVLPQGFDGNDFQVVRADPSGRLITMPASTPLAHLDPTTLNAGGTRDLADAPASALRAVIVMESGRLRVTLSGAAATATRGLLLSEGDSIELDSPAEISGFRSYALDVGTVFHIVFYGA